VIKIYVLDTSTIIHDPYCLERFPNSNIVIPVYVLNELDKLKKFPSYVGRNARVFIRLLDDICQLGNINKGIVLDDISSFIRVDIEYDDLTKFGDPTYNDNKILACACRLNQTADIVLVSRDITLRIKGEAFELTTENYEKDQDKDKQVSSIYSGVKFIKNAELSGRLCEEGFVACEEYKELEEVLPNECVYITDEYGSGVTLGRKIRNEIKRIRTKEVWGLETRNKEQAFAVDLLLDPDVKLVSLIGIAGVGKSLLAIAAGLELLIGKKEYSNLIVYRPIQPIGKELGFLPGTITEKLGPWMEAVNDSFELLTSKYETSEARRKRKVKGKKNNKKWRESLFQYSDFIHLEPITYIRGRSIPNSYIILDESQNLNKHQIKTVLTRVGEGTKIVLTGDVEQTDNEDLDAINNGLTHVSSAFRHSPIAGHITLVRGERSKLATEAAKIL
jgi:PhoH-like ATPase